MATAMGSVHTLPHAAQAPGVLRPIPVSDHGSRCGMAAATSVFQLCLHELDGSLIDRDVAREFARRIIRSYLDQVERVARTEA